jgi:hypothetical protein
MDMDEVRQLITAEEMHQWLRLFPVERWYRNIACMAFDDKVPTKSRWRKEHKQFAEYAIRAMESESIIKGLSEYRFAYELFGFNYNTIAIILCGIISTDYEVIQDCPVILRRMVAPHQ